eukprot:scaffold224723_cov21-Tisochrysis_lutea.AAC.1
MGTATQQAQQANAKTQAQAGLRRCALMGNDCPQIHTSTSCLTRKQHPKGCISPQRFTHTPALFAGLLKTHQAFDGRQRRVWNGQHHDHKNRGVDVGRDAQVKQGSGQRGRLAVQGAHQPLACVRVRAC